VRGLSFSGEVKQELSRIFLGQCCQRAELAALILTAGSINIPCGSKRAFIHIKTEHAPTIRKCYKLLKKYLDGPIVELIVKRNNYFKEHNQYIVSVKASSVISFLSNWKIIKPLDDNIFFTLFSKPIITKRCCRRAFLRGAFLGSGSICDPRKPYHLEFVAAGKVQADFLAELANSFGLKSKVTQRKNNYVVYLKDSDKISELLGIMGAFNSLLKFEDVRVIKQVRNSVNRVVNCETANLNKTISASMRQIDNIKFLKDVKVFYELPENLKAIAEARLMAPDLSLKELGEMMDPPLGKSGVSHRLKKIDNIAEAIKSKKRKIEKTQKSD
jgi:DNA-binding protein WhiA